MDAVYKPEFSEVYVKRLAELKEKWLGNFSTKLWCCCGKAHITDHATEAVPNAPRPLGPQPGPYWELRNFKPVHHYWCDSCGLVYKPEVIETVRGYVPRERTGFGKAMLRVAADM